MFIINLIRRLLCKHSYSYICGAEKTEDNDTFFIRLYICEHCRKRLWIDSRHDMFR